MSYRRRVSSPAPLARRLGLGDATVIGVGSMVGAGVFAAFAPAAQAAGSGLLIGLMVAGVVALGNATSTAQLAAASPRSGGAYLYGRERLGAVWGFVAGWGFVIGKIASCAAMALTFAAYAAPAGWERPIAVAAVVALAAVNLWGITRTALATRIIVALVLLVLAIVVAAGASRGVPPVGDPLELVASGPYGILQASGLLFFAFAGYARIATLGEEVRDPERVIPRAIVLALGIALVVYLGVGLAALAALGADGLAASRAPLEDVVSSAGWDWASPVVRVGAAAASLGALLALLAGIGRTTLAMARERDVPSWFAAVHPRTHVPHRAEIVIAAAVCVIVLAVDLRGAIGFSSFGVLVYYVIAGLSALRQPAAERRFPRILAVIGVVGCVVLAATLPWPSVVGGVIVIILGFGVRFLSRRAVASNS